MEPLRRRIYLSPPHMGGAELELVREAFAGNWIAPLGPFVDRFEKDAAAFVGRGHAAALSSGTAALHLALRIVGVGPGDEVLCSDFTFAASATPIVYQGARPVFIDSEAASWNMDPELLREELRACAGRGRLPKAAVVVHLYGQCADMDPILAACADYGVPVIEDAAEALGAAYRGRPAGGMGLASVLSFNGNKIITTSGGGMLLSDEAGLIAQARFLATQARDPAPHYEHSQLGFNYRMSNVLAAIGVGQLAVIRERVARKRWVFEQYRRRLGGVPGLAFMPEPEWSRSNRWLTCATIDSPKPGAGAESVRLALEAEDIESRPLWKPMHLQPVFQGCRCRLSGVSEQLFARGLCLPSGTALTEADFDRITGIVRRICV